MAVGTLPWEAANATLLELSGPGGLDWYGDATAEGSELWQGELEAQLQSQHRNVITGGANTPVENDVLIVRKPPPVLAKATAGDQGTGQTVLVRDERTTEPVTMRFRITAVEHRGKGEAESVRYQLADARPDTD